ncbi:MULTISPECIES: glycosyltransferase family 2 protein [unclassified Fibrobacter]|uniref:glycosyltransferase family 2 protein n=1 Tax=unclassified Fibrobacter TaxID=2634177 RepID=UPI000D6B7AD4|nr:MULTISPECIES: glycosyltransferase family 2 protein [unclassified Fibrobacter]PWJ61721.1 glycosyl transferase family 2 [Fibrobacter sp. UWR4]PZW67377.1 glycosyl transferase family 2 [Fibrobacter sp. UWR1]
MADTFIFVPAYNVEKTLGDVLAAIPESVWARSEVQVIDDGSTDNTRGAYEAFVKAHPNRPLFYFRFDKNSGYGAVVKKGLRLGTAGSYRYVACLHGDGQYPANLLDKFLEHLENASAPTGEKFALLQGSRHATRGSAKAGNMPLHKRIGGAFLTALENLVFKTPLTDRHSGFILYRTSFLKTIELERLSPSFDIDLELIVLADARKFALGELPIPTVYADEVSNLNVITYGLRCLRLVWRRFWMK